MIYLYLAKLFYKAKNIVPVINTQLTESNKTIVPSFLYQKLTLQLKLVAQ